MEPLGNDRFRAAFPSPPDGPLPLHRRGVDRPLRLLAARSGEAPRRRPGRGGGPADRRRPAPGGGDAGALIGQAGGRRQDARGPRRRPLCPRQESRAPKGHRPRPRPGDRRRRRALPRPLVRDPLRPGSSSSSSTASAPASPPGTRPSPAPRAPDPGPARATAPSPPWRSGCPTSPAMGFDVLYLPPIHPIGETHRKGRNNARTLQADDVGSPWAMEIGPRPREAAPHRQGGHKAIHPELGTPEDFRHLVAAANELGIEIALDVAFQCSPDHPYVHEHPEWFRKRPDGTIQYAENPPKKYEDIVPVRLRVRRLAGALERARERLRALDRRGGRDLPGRQPAHQVARASGSG